MTIDNVPFRIEAETEALRIARGEVNLDGCDTAVLFQPVVGPPPNYIPSDIAKSVQRTKYKLKKLLKTLDGP